jgi:nitrogen regulatory protein P-II 1
MKQVTAIIRAPRLNPVKDALLRAGIHGLTLTEVSGFGRQGGSVEQYRGVQYRVDFVQKLKVEVLVEDEIVDDVVSAIMAAAHSGQVGDGKIWVTPVEAVYRIRTGERDTAALV